MQLNGHAGAGVSNTPPSVTTATNDNRNSNSTPEAPPASARVRLYQKLARVYEDVKYVQKDKRNSFHGYNYASEAAIKAALHEAFATAGLILLPPRILDVKDELRTGEKEKQTYLTTIRIQLAIADIESGETIEGEIYGRGVDGQDKGIYKALTGALKYWLTTTFLIATGDDPEEDTSQPDDAPPPARWQSRSQAPPADEPPPTRRQSRERPQAELNAAAGIDTGGHPVGTQAAADYVAQQKLTAAAKPARPWKTLAEAKRIILALREKVGETAFLAEMAKYRFRTVDNFDPRKPDEVVELYHSLMFLSDGEVM